MFSNEANLCIVDNNKQSIMCNFSDSFAMSVSECVCEVDTLLCLPKFYISRHIHIY